MNPKFLHTALGLFALLLPESSLAQSCSTIPSEYSFSGSSLLLPDPFTFLNGTKVVTKDAWACRRDEILALFQAYELGPLPPAVETVSATVSSNRLNIVVSANGKTLSFAPSIRLPSGTGPFPAIIALGGASVPIPSNVALTILNNEEIAATDPRGKGKFFDFFGRDQKTGGLLAWAWAVSRIMDALEKLGPAATKINPERVGVTGCSRNGKGAFVSGAFDSRIRLTLPQEAGSGGMGCWRIVAEMKKNGTKVEDASQIVNGDQWFSTDFSKYVNDLSKLPLDHHFLAGLVAPRGLLVIENSGIDYLGPVSTYGCASAGRLIYTALSSERHMGFAQAAHGSSHCQLPASLRADVTTYIDWWLLDKTTPASIFKTDKTYNFHLGRWVHWTVPNLV
ncbi:putative carbohydrate esterase family 15 protein [Triangularia verruculosa]|uniref:(4-O-methyl)-D-glucuronate--lignin esterase n=1 Tax=Triangularia verruculosa TaxID=2587418 RepID=A0AAN7ARQ5_9PEZI|nr:putative carbohydrate esterase family 15 protein [Triangularia verruculosa]